MAYEAYKFMHNVILEKAIHLPTRKLVLRLERGIHLSVNRLHSTTDLLTLIGQTYWAPPHMRRN